MINSQIRSQLKKNPIYRKAFTGFFEKHSWERFVDQYINPKYLIYDPKTRAKEETRLRRQGRWRSPTPSIASTETSSGLESVGSARLGRPGMPVRVPRQGGDRGRSYGYPSYPAPEEFYGIAGGQGEQVLGTSRRRPGQQFLTSEPADEIPEEDAASSVGFHAPDASTVHAPSMEAGAPPVRRRKVGTPQSVHGRNLRRQIMPVLRQANFSLRKVSANRYLVYAKDVSEGVIAQIRGLLKKITGRRVLVDGRIFGKQGAFREIIRVLREKGSVDVSVS